MNDLESNYNSEYVFFYRITLRDEKHQIVKTLVWSDFPNRVFQKWYWYFKYRAALLQVEYPKHRVDCNWGVQREMSEKSETEILKNKIIAKKRKITEIDNKLNKAKSQYNEIFEFEEHPIVKRFLEKREKLTKELNELLL